ncbi:Hydroxyacylglutathione hydrolase [uncultured archaeon]|nr:Hydroxyacylglutathione hydrolase [uncultured archaeon]
MISPGGFESNMYLVNRELLIDAGTGLHPKILVRELHELGIFFEDIKRIVLTHAHFDHAGGVHLFKAAKVGIHKDDAEIIEKGDNSGSMANMFSASLKKKPVDFMLDDGDLIKSGDLKLKVIHTPGHTKGSICFYDEKNKILFSGDTVFSEGFGRIDFPGGSSNEMRDSLERLSKLDVNMILPGHGAPVWGSGNETIKRLLM